MIREECWVSFTGLGHFPLKPWFYSMNQYDSVSALQAKKPASFVDVNDRRIAPAGHNILSSPTSNLWKNKTKNRTIKKQDQGQAIVFAKNIPICLCSLKFNESNLFVGGGCLRSNLPHYKYLQYPVNMGTQWKKSGSLATNAYSMLLGLPGPIYTQLYLHIQHLFQLGYTLTCIYSVWKKCSHSAHPSFGKSSKPSTFGF